MAARLLISTRGQSPALDADVRTGHKPTSLRRLLLRRLARLRQDPSPGFRSVLGAYGAAIIVQDDLDDTYQKID
jgi:hypothetical protein